MLAPPPDLSGGSLAISRLVWNRHPAVSFQKLGPSGCSETKARPASPAQGLSDTEIRKTRLNETLLELPKPAANIIAPN